MIINNATISTPVLLPGKSHGQRSLVGCSPWGRWELDTTQWLHFPFSVSCIGEGNGNPLQCSCLENPRDGGTWWAAVYGVAQIRTQLKRLSSSSSKHSLKGFCVKIAFISLLPSHFEDSIEWMGIRLEFKKISFVYVNCSFFLQTVASGNNFLNYDVVSSKSLIWILYPLKYDDKGRWASFFLVKLSSFPKNCIWQRLEFLT